MKKQERLAELTEKYHLAKNNNGIFTISIKERELEITDFSLIENLKLVTPHIMFKEELIERLKRIDMKYDYIFKDPDFEKEKRERQAFLLDDFNFTIFEALKSMTYLFNVINFEKPDFHYLFPKKPFDILKMLLDIVDCVDYAIFMGLVKLNKQIQNNEIPMVIIDPETNKRIDGFEPIIEAIKDIISNFDKESKNDGQIDLNSIDLKYMGRA
jgi:hypothetical protein